MPTAAPRPGLPCCHARAQEMKPQMKKALSALLIAATAGLLPAATASATTTTVATDAAALKVAKAKLTSVLSSYATTPASTAQYNAAEAVVKAARPDYGYYWVFPCKLVATATVDKTVHMSLPWDVANGGPNSGYYGSTCSYYESSAQAEPNVDIGLQENQA